MIAGLLALLLYLLGMRMMYSNFAGVEFFLNEDGQNFDFMAKVRMLLGWPFFVLWDIVEDLRGNDYE